MTAAQPFEALERANRVRLEMSAIRREIRDGTVTAAAALYDPRAEPLQLGRLLGAQPHWGPHRVRDTLRDLHDATWGDHVVDLNIAMRVRDLTERQRAELATWLMVGQ